MKFILTAATLCFLTFVFGQTSPPLPPGLEPPPLAIQFGGPPVFGISEKHISSYINARDFTLPANYYVRTSVTNIPAEVWNRTVGTKLKALPVDIDGITTNVVKRLGDPLVAEVIRTACIAAFFDLGGGVEHFEIAVNGEIEMAWINELGFQTYVQLSKNHGVQADEWRIKYVNNRAWYAIDRQRLAAARAWNSAP